MTKLALIPMAPLQYLLDSPGLTHEHCLKQAYIVLKQDGKEAMSPFFQPYHSWIRKGLFWANKGWKNVCHYYADPANPSKLSWPGASGEAQYYYNQAMLNFPVDVLKGMFYLGAALHIIQDMCVPHHSQGVVFDGHQEFERWARKHWQEFAVTEKGLYMDFTHPSQWIEYNARQEETLQLRSGLVECKPQPNRSTEYLLYAAIKEAFLLNKSEPDPYYFARREEVTRLIQEPEKYLRSAFQPILDVVSGDIYGFEALARLNPPSSFLSISELFPFAEKIGKLYPIETICRQSAISLASKIIQSHELLFLNVDPQVLTDPEFASGQTRKLLTSQGLDPHKVVLELTERSAIQDFSTFREALEHYRKQGYLIALDDVGSGYSSLQSIAELHPDFLKIDRSLIREIHINPTKWALLETFITFSRRIGCRILAEGVETEDEMRTVVQLGVDYIQGYYLARPSFERPNINPEALKIIQSRKKLRVDSPR